MIPDGRQRFAVPGHIEGNDPVPVEYLRIVQKVAVLGRIRSRGMETDEGNAASRFLEINPVGASGDFAMDVAPDDIFYSVFHHGAFIRPPSVRQAVP